jgi:hypothetical protein
MHKDDFAQNIRAPAKKTSFYVLPVLVAQQCITSHTSAIATACTEKNVSTFTKTESFISGS